MSSTFSKQVLKKAFDSDELGGIPPSQSHLRRQRLLVLWTQGVPCMYFAENVQKFWLSESKPKICASSVYQIRASDGILFEWNTCCSDGIPVVWMPARHYWWRPCLPPWYVSSNGPFRISVCPIWHCFVVKYSLDIKGNLQHKFLIRKWPPPKKNPRNHFPFLVLWFILVFLLGINALLVDTTTTEERTTRHLWSMSSASSSSLSSSSSLFLSSSLSLS